MDRHKPYDEPLFEMPAENEQGAAASREQEHERYDRLTASVWPAIEAIMRNASRQVEGAPLAPAAMDVFEAHVSLSTPEIVVTSTDTLTGRDFTRVINERELWGILVAEYSSSTASAPGKDAFIVVVDHTDKEAAFF